MFPSREKTLWLKLNEQRFEIDISVDGDIYGYKLEIKHDEELRKAEVTTETLHINDGKPLFIYNNGTAIIYRDDHSQGTECSFKGKRSGVGFFDESKDNKLFFAI